MADSARVSVDNCLRPATISACEGAVGLRCYFRIPDWPISHRKFRRKSISGLFPAEFRVILIFPAGTYSEGEPGVITGIPVFTGFNLIPVFVGIPILPGFLFNSGT
jgi:hypothetical protein